MVLRVRGFTLLELLVALGLLAILAGAAAPGVSAVLGSLELRAGALRLASALGRARVAALAEGRPWRVRIVDATTFEVGAEGARPERNVLPGRVRFASATSGGDVLFRPDGWAENATFRLARDERSRSVVVNQRGRVTLPAGEAS